ncbi:glycoside hydrolase family 105 protein [Pyronema domesticum]|uniref:Similar to Unsaturated rhamnogalacturonyl hydrolase YesR acc. no. O31521 n=1 Tax=Pyronema omphalodes (strain CBS 100304) TaxID=1076935 RepID=U4LLI6_PYROM|nr:glycoside hydrolase family 105 protein [Pyronema domesticum]CCX32994.1 Similar to Unsaturated rhamnogalacturonyl hydrolase YesR; acc. no. O31521 [Pyronema omphalodes CBS 100304]
MNPLSSFPRVTNDDRLLIPSYVIHKTLDRLINSLVMIHDTTGEFLLRLPDGRVIDTKSWDTDKWEWTHGIGLYGLYQHSRLVPAPTSNSLSLVNEWFTHRLSFSSDGTSKNINTMSVFLTLACLYSDTKKPEYLPWLEAWGDWAMHDLDRTALGGMQHVTYLSEHEQQLWADTLMMTVLPLAKIGLVLRKPEYVEEAKRQMLLHIQYLFNTQTGLFYHGWTFIRRHNFAGAAWARGNAWVVMAIPEMLEMLDLPKEDAFRMHLQETLSTLCHALRLHQTERGAWNTVLNASDERNYEESSATAGIAAGMLKAVRKRYLPQFYRETAFKAITFVVDNVDDATGELKGTSFGTPVMDKTEEYYAIEQTCMPYGQAMAILALTEALRTYY